MTAPGQPAPPDPAPATTPLARRDLVVSEARRLGFADVGVAPADTRLLRTEQVRAAVQGGRLAPFGWYADSLEVRLDVNEGFPGVKSVIVLVQNYYAGDHRDHVSPQALETGAKISRYAWGRDYHNVMRRRLRKMRKTLMTAFGEGAVVVPFTDDKPVLERAWAEACGLGFIGKSTMFIHRGLGTWTFLAGLLTNQDIAPLQKPVLPDYCGTCTRCLDACPTGAFDAPFTLDANRCLTTWNIEKPTDPRAEAFAGHGWAAGCDVCQEVCPYNRFETRTDEERFHPAAGHVVVNPQTLPHDIVGTPLARAKAEGLAAATERALRSRSNKTETT